MVLEAEIPRAAVLLQDGTTVVGVYAERMTWWTRKLVRLRN